MIINMKEIRITHILSCIIRNNSSANDTKFRKLRAVCGIMEDLQGQESKQSYVRVYCTVPPTGKKNLIPDFQIT